MTVWVDVRTMQFFARFHGRWPKLDFTIVSLNNSELIRGGAVMCLFWWVFFAKAKSPEAETLKRAKLTAALPAALLAVVLARVLANQLPFRQRPFMLPQFHAFWSNVDLRGYESWSSFPSDHAALFMAIAIALFLVSRWVGSAAVLYVAVAICVPRLYVGLHWFSDVAVGALLGALAGSLVTIKSFRYRIWQVTMRWKEMAPGSLAAFAVYLTCSIWTVFSDTRGLARMVLALLSHKKGV
jgi:undecaprenyl-diphosphatase